VSKRVLLLRPEPGATRSAVRSRALGLEPTVAPLFTVRRVAWEAPSPEGYDAVLLTSGHAAREAGAELQAFVHLRCYALGESSASAAADAGFTRIETGSGDGAAAVAMMIRDGVRRALHPCGRDHLDLGDPGVAIDRRIVYAADAVAALSPAACSALDAGAHVLLHSPRAASLFAVLADDAGRKRSAISLVAISQAVADAAGSGWKSVAVAARPRDDALLELAAKLCKTAAAR
jgi:uroporphyrinogen-III synthase